MRIRLAEPDDVPAMQAIYAPIVVETTISFEYEPPSVDEMARRVAATLPRYPWLVADEGGTILGYAYAGAHSDRQAYDWSADVSVYVDAGYRRKGLGRGLYAPLFELLRRQGFRGVYAGITLPNPGSVRLHESLGLAPVGVYHRVGWKHGAWRDVGWWQGRLGDESDDSTEPPGPVRSLDDLTPEEIAEALAD